MNNQIQQVKKVLFWVLSVFLFLTPFLLYGGYLYAGSSSRAVTLMVLMSVLSIGVAGGLLFSKQRIHIIKSPIVLVSAAYVLVAGISMFVGVDSSISFWSKATRMTGLFYFSHLAMLYILCTWLFFDTTYTRQLIKSFVYGAVFFSIGYLIGPDGFKWIFADKPWDGFTFVNSSFAAMYLYAAWMLWVWYIYTQEPTKRVWWQYLLLVLLVIHPSFINPLVWKGDFSGGVIGESFASTYALIASIGALLVAQSIGYIRSADRRKVATFVVVGSTIIAVAITTISLVSRDGIVQGLYKSQSSLARPIVWELSRSAITERPLFGWGPENFELAYQQHYDNKVLEERNGAEPWFDRAHNIIIDQLVDTGYVGTIAYLLVYFVVIGGMVFVVTRSSDRTDRVSAVVVMVYMVGHFAELQTAFDTSISYIPLALIMALGTVVLHRAQSHSTPERKYEWVLSRPTQIIVGVGILGYFTWGFFFGVVPIVQAQSANGLVRTVGSTEKRLDVYSTLFGSPLDTASFVWRTSTDFQRGIAADPQVLADPRKVQMLIKELDVFADTYIDHIAKHPYDIRAKIALADIYIYYRLFDVDKLIDAHSILDAVIDQNPNLPQPYRMKAVAYLYQANFADARLWAQKALAVNPAIEETQRLAEYIDQSIRQFPDIDLYFFKQI